MTTAELYAIADALLSRWANAEHLPADVLRQFQNIENKLKIINQQS